METATGIEQNDMPMTDTIAAWDWTRVLTEFRDPLRRYVEYGIVPEGYLLRSVLANQLAESLLYYDEASANTIRRLLVFIRHYLPAQSWGSPERMARWEEQGGLTRRNESVSQ
jgi:hypothetical protein